MQLTRKLIGAGLLCLGNSALLPVQAQFSYRQTVGNNAVIQPASFYSRKYRGGLINTPSITPSDGILGSFTRHRRIGESTGIGGSTLQTTSVTSETRPALERPFSVSLGTPLIGRPTLDLNFESASKSPALRTFAVSYPDSGVSEGNHALETFTGSTSLTKLNKLFSSTADNFEFGN